MSEQDMFQYKPFEQGVWGVLHAEWKLKTKTPLTIRSGAKAAFQQDSQERPKGRGTDPKLVWEHASTLLQKKDKKYSEIADFYYTFKAENGVLSCDYHIPASSIRGALRDSAIARKVEFENRALFSLMKKDKAVKQDEDNTSASAQTLADIEKQIETAKQQLIEKRNGWYAILSLFGIAFNPSEDPENPLTWAGRLCIETRLNQPGDTRVTINDQQVDVKGGPQNIPRTVSLRSPVDRTTQSAKAAGGGLHYWLELPAGNTFTVKLQIANPTQSDVDLLDFWLREIVKESLCFGALQSIGRGKVKMADQTYALFVSPVAKYVQDLKSYPEVKIDHTQADPLAGFWQGAKLTFEQLKTLIEKGQNNGKA